MKTIFDKIDPQYIECSTGICEHASHMHVLPTYIVTGVIGILMVVRLLKRKSHGLR